MHYSKQKRKFPLAKGTFSESAPTVALRGFVPSKRRLSRAGNSTVNEARGNIWKSSKAHLPKTLRVIS
jgi:hypothetical protein